MTEKQLGGPNRFVSDGLATTRECRSLVEVAKMFAILGDGYKGKRSPHTDLEKFEGVTLNRIALLVYFGLLDPLYLEIFLRLTEESRLKVISYFGIERQLFFTYTHLVCRSALPESSENRTDFSHSIHADNCNLLGDHTCEKRNPAYHWRSYSAIIYLNDKFEGGEFVFSADPFADKIQSRIKPKCGRMVGFSSGRENLHGVRAVTKGSRCAIGVWFTFDEKRQETERTLAYQLLSSLSNSR